MLDRLYSVTLALVAELAVTRARLDTVERLLARRSVVGAQEIDAYRPADAEEVEARSRLHAEYLERMFREFTPVTRGDTPR